ncbi:hypothetical protein D3C76_1841140 [compost metagenome]
MDGVGENVAQDAADFFAHAVVVHVQVYLAVADFVPQGLQLQRVQRSEGAENVALRR